MSVKNTNIIKEKHSKHQSKTCSYCGILKPVYEFYLSKKGKFGRQSRCKICRSILEKEYLNRPGKKEHKQKMRYVWGKNNIDKIKAIQRKQTCKKYGITTEQYEQQKEKQNGRCLLCNSEKKLCIDHDHKTGVFRGLLCNNCNRSLGLLKENIETMQKMIIYVSQWNRGKKEEYKDRKVYKKRSILKDTS